MLCTRTALSIMIYTAISSQPASALVATVAQGSSEASHEVNFTFSPNSVTVFGGSGHFSYRWYRNDDGLGYWIAKGRRQKYSPLVEAVLNCKTTRASYYVLVTDLATGEVVRSNNARYFYTLISDRDCQVDRSSINH